MNVKTQKFQSLYVLVCKSSARSNHRTTLPQSRPFRRASSLREGAGNGCTIHPATQKPQRCGRFSSPLRKGCPKTSGFHRKNDTGWARAPPYGNQPKAQLKKGESGQTLPRRKPRRLCPRRAIRTWARGNQPVPAAEKRKSCGGQHTAAADFLRQK